MAADGKVVWALIQAAADDPDPSPEHEAQFGGANMDPATLSLNTVRAEAIHCAVRYALWRLRQRSKVEPGGPGSTQEFQGFDTVRSLLEQHLDIAIDPSLGVRAVYGQWFPWLVVLDSAWAASKVEAIFPPDIDARPWFGASWGTYIKYCAPYSNVLPILRGTYAAAIEMLNAETAEPLRDRFADNLGEHLLAYYWRGEVTLDPSDLVAAFFQVADAKERRKALEWVGWTLMRAEAPLPEQAASRLQSLWDWRWSADDRVQEGAAFSGWFASGRLDPTWSLDRLTKLLEANVLPDPDHIVVERLASMSTATPLQRVRLVRSMVELARKGWSISAWIDDAKSTIETALESSDSAAKEEAARLIDRLGAIGFRGLRDLSRKSI
jgi:hypothetical protein